MKCPQYSSTQVRKNGRRYGKQCYHCKKCARQFIEKRTHQGYHPEVKKLCLKRDLNGMSFRALERITKIHHTTIINWVKKAGIQLRSEAIEAEKLLLR